MCNGQNFKTDRISHVYVYMQRKKCVKKWNEKLPRMCLILLNLEDFWARLTLLSFTNNIPLNLEDFWAG